MDRRTKPLTCDNIRSIIRAHPTVFAAMGGMRADTKEEASHAIANAILANSSVVDSVVAAGMGIESAAAGRLGLFKWLAAADILAQTAVADIPLLPVLYEELAPLCFGSGALQ